MNLLLILNEIEYGAHVDVHNAFNKLVKNKKLSSYNIYPFSEKINKGINLIQIRDETKELINSYKPELILFSHTGGLKIDFKYLFSTLNLKFKPAIGYWDADIYHRFVKPLPKEIKKIITYSDTCFWCGFDSITRRIAKKMRKDIRYVPLSTDERFINKRADVKKKYDVVMVGNYVTSKIPFKTFPGSKYRKKIAGFLYERLGSKFAVYGNGWNENYAKGPIPFEKQYEAYQSGKISLGINNLNADYYFSNRLPISLSCGVIMLHNYEYGIEKIFSELKYNYFFNNERLLWERSKIVLAKSDSDINEEVKSYQKFASEKMAMYNNLEFMIKVLKDYFNAKNYDTNLKNRVNPWTKFNEPHKY